MPEIRIPIENKILWTVEEAAAASHIGENRLRELLAKPTCPFILNVGNKKLIKVDEFKDYVSHRVSI